MKTARGEYRPKPGERYAYGRHPARCNKRSCQSRRNLTKHPALYVKWPRCAVAGCGGLMYVDWYRMKGGARDNPPVCRDACCGYLHPATNDRPCHRINTRGCSGYAAYIAKRNSAPRSNHSPIPAGDWVPF